MPLPRTTDFCPICGARLNGRRDKRFCSNACRALYFRNKSDEIIPATRDVDAILHKNWKILSELYTTIGKRKFFVELSILSRKGFHPDYYTSTVQNAQAKQYF
ncbi:MAG TPA: hypothetical protein VI603_16245 [Saprospiraceae bacterium]|nr:hypothetical protein [Saprospiraceae bacterium]